MNKRILVFSVSVIALFLTASVSHSFTITPSAGPGGSISPSTPVYVPLNGSKTFTITPDNGYEIFDVVMDSISLGPVPSYTFPGVKADHTITASFTECTYKVMLEWDSSLFITITEAYDYSIISGLNDITLKLVAGSLIQEDLYFDADISVLLDGGYDCSFQTKNGASGLPGSLRIAAGKVSVSNLGVENGAVCPENDPNNFPGNPEICDGLDNNCNGVADEGLTFDVDGDGSTSIGSCAGSVDDCNDNAPYNFPGNPEICDSLDNNCDGQIDEGLTAVDTDGDGYTAIGSCGSSDDCNDNDDSIHPGATEICDGLDNNCDNQVDEGFDIDGDTVTTCGGDCDDSDPNNFPGNPEICDGLDNNCDSQIDEGLTAIDVDGDGYSAIGSCGGSADDCNDNDPSIHPYGEIYGDGIDQDCDGQDLIFPSDNTCFGGNCHTEYVVNTLMHTNVMPPDGTCADCHAAPVVGVLPSHYGLTVGTAGNNMIAGSRIGCTSCHDWHDPAEYDVQGDYIVWAKVHGAGGYGNLTCDTCHENRAALHEAVFDHTGIVTTTATQCGFCHTSTPLVDPADAKVHNSCSSCHGANLVLVSLAAGKSAPGNCNSCHGSDFTTAHPEPTSDHTALVTVGTTGCADCHTDTPLVSAAADTHNACISCHTTDGDLISSAIGKTFASGGDCTTCHTGTWETLHPTTGFDHTVIVTTTGTQCGTCHTDTPLVSAAADTHNACTSCHDATTGALISIAIGNTTGNCATCHGADFTTNHPEPTSDHTALVTVGATGCADCHTDTPLVSAAADTHNACTSCHDANGGLVSSAIGKSFAVGGDCATCHTGTWEALHPTTGFDHTVIVTTAGTQCSTCHADTPLVSAAADTHNACTSCHDATTGALINIAIGNTTGNCATCHGADFTANHPEPASDHTALITVGATDCADCHTDTPLVSAAADTHNACTSCHDANGGLISSAIGRNFTTGGDCATCHTDLFDTIHAAHAHTVAVGAGDLSFNPPGTLCSACHVVANWNEIDGTEHNVATNGAGSCATCHNSPRQEVIDAIALGANPTNCLDCHSNKNLTVHGAEDHVALGYVTLGVTSCTSCHDPGGATNATINITHNGNCNLCHTTVPNLQPGVPAGGGDCATCHTGTWETLHPTTGFDHTVIVTTVGTQCSTCHADTPLVSAAADTHNACTSCHDATTGALISIAIGNTTGNCATCHGTDFIMNHPEPVSDHTALVTVGATGCADCHTDTPLVSAAADTHNACTSCHDANGGLVSSAIGKSFATGGDCATCHTGTWESTHTTDPGHTGITVGATGCADCHDDTLLSAAPETHNTCTSCHDSGSGSLIGSAIGNPSPTDCTTCHTGTWDATHTTDPGHTGITVGATGCASCHDDTLVSAAPETHNACTSCHDSGSGALIGSAIGNPSPTDCTTCHTGTWDATHTTDPGHTGITVGATGCASCHDDTLVSAAPETHDACTSCHDSGSGALIGSAIGNPIPTDCTTCHTGTWDAMHTTDPGHAGITVGATGCASCHDDTLLSAAPETHDACTSCHDSGDGSLIGSAIGNPIPTDCTTCHTGTWDAMHTTDPGHAGITVGATGCASCHDDTLLSAAPETHDACTSCHDSGDGSLIGSAIGNPTPTDCTTCHTGTWDATHTTDPGHTGITVGATGCASCHDDTLLSAAPETHDACTSCHDSGSGALIGSAIGNPTPTDCTTCHTGTWESTHTNDPGHTGITVGATGCADCHDDTLLSAAPETHNTCNSCHDSGSGALIGSAIGNPTPIDCTTCHTGAWDATHTTDPGHTGITVGATGCADCHDDTLLSAAPETHDACTSCHDSDSGALIGSAIGNPTPTDCATCHTGTWDTLHVSHAHTVAVGSGDLSSGTLCTSCHAVANWTEIEIKHDVATNGAGSCATCHNSPRQEVIDSVTLAADPTNCLNCHSDKSVAHADHVAAGYVTVGGAQDYYTPTSYCVDCHDPGGAPNATVDVIHSGNCNLCHTTIPNLKGGIPAGGGDCVACHVGETATTGGTHTLWGRYMDTCATSGCHTFGGPGTSQHDIHNAGTWDTAAADQTDRENATAGMTYTYGNDPGMWEPDWPLTPGCQTCHELFSNDARRSGCATCHAFGQKGDMHDTHSNSTKKGGLEIDCAVCHFQS